MTTKPADAPPGSGGIRDLDPFFGVQTRIRLCRTRNLLMTLCCKTPDIHYALQILGRCGGRRSGIDVFMDTNSIIYYDPENRNRRVQPDVYVSPLTVLMPRLSCQRNGYLLWEVGKPPDLRSRSSVGFHCGQRHQAT